MSAGILVLIEHLKGEITDISFEMLGVGRTLADALQIPLESVVIGPGGAALAGRLGAADTVLLVEDPQLEMPSTEAVTALLHSLLQQQAASLVLVGGTNVSMGIGTRLAIRAGLRMVNFCKEIKVDKGEIVATSQLFGGKILADVRLPDHRGVISVYPGSFPADAGRRQGTPAVKKLTLPVPGPAVTFRRFIEPAAGDVDITKQDVLVSVGRGIQSADNLGLAEELAGVLGGAVSASRPVIDQGWLPLTRQVGKSGMNVKPKLYLALGISGAPEHQEGMKGAQLIVAVNTDPKAPIFNIAHYGVSADLFDIVPALKEAVEQKKKGV